jgi:hypothetical protein
MMSRRFNTSLLSSFLAKTATYLVMLTDFPDYIVQECKLDKLIVRTHIMESPKSSPPRRSHVYIIEQFPGASIQVLQP